MKVHLRTIDLARATGITVQQVRSYETYGFLPVVERGANGYRRYTQHHCAALQTVHALCAGYGEAATRQIMDAVYRQQHARALALIDTYHAELAHTRTRLEQMLAALHVLAASPPPTTLYPPARLRVREAALHVGVPVSTVRFWEREGLIRPHRDRTNKYRLFDEQSMRRLHMIALLRQVDYALPDIRATLAELDDGHPQKVAEAIMRRRAELDRTSWRCVEGLAVFRVYVQQWHPFH